MDNDKRLEAKKALLDKLFRKCVIVQEFFIDVKKRKGKDCSHNVDKKKYLIERYEMHKQQVVLINRQISGYRAAIKDLNEDVRDFLSEEEQAELKQRIKDELGADMV